MKTTTNTQELKMRLTKKQIIDTVNKLKMDASYKQVLIKQCLENNPNARFVVCRYYKKQLKS